MSPTYAVETQITNFSNGTTMPLHYMVYRDVCVCGMCVCVRDVCVRDVCVRDVCV